MATTTPEKCVQLSLLPEGMKQVPSHLSWMEELSGHLLEERPLDKETSLKEYLQSLMEPRNKLLQRDMENEEELQMTEEMEVAKHLNWAAMNIYLGDLKFAEENLKVLDQLEDNSLELTARKLEVFQYCRDVLRWVMDHEKASVGPFRIRWDAINQSDEGKAVVCFLKGELSLILGLPGHITQPFYMEAIKLEPGCALWYHGAYLTAVKIRKASSTSPAFQSNEEERFAQKAFELTPNDLISLTTYAAMLKEKIWKWRADYWNSHELEYLQVVQLLTKALEMAKEKHSKKWMRLARGYLGELLCFGKGDKLDRWEGLRLLEECAKDNPNSWILHKLARVYHYGFGGRGEGVNLPLAEETYLRGMKESVTNFPCLMDYLKLLHQRQGYGEMMDALDKALIVATEPFWMTKLRGIKAFLTWVRNPNNISSNKEAAIEELLTGFEQFPNYRQGLLMHRYDFDFSNERVKAEIVRYCREQHRTGTYAQRVQLLANEMSQHVPTFGQHSQRGEAGGGSRMWGQAGRMWGGAERRYSPADMDNNWRK